MDTQDKILCRISCGDARVALVKHTAQRHLRGGRYCEAYGNVLKLVTDSSLN
jgi:hypothetical protein